MAALRNGGPSEWRPLGMAALRNGGPQTSSWFGHCEIYTRFGNKDAALSADSNHVLSTLKHY